MMNKESSFFIHSKAFYKGLALFGSLCLVMLFAFLGWASTKGFELSDESYYTVGYYFNIQTDNSVSFFHKIYNTFFGWLSFSLAQNRILASVLVLGSSVFLAKEVSMLIEIKNKWVFYFFVLIMSGLYHTIFPMAVSYNVFSAVFINGFIASTIGLVNRGHWIYAILIGLFLSLLILNKFTNLVAVLFFVFSYSIMYFEKIKQRNWYLTFGLITVGFVISLLFVFENYQGLMNSYQGFKNGLALTTEHSLSNMITKFIDNARSILSKTVYLFPLFGVLAFLKFYKLKFENKLVFLSVVFTYIFLIYKFWFFIGNYQIVLFYYFTFVIVLSLMVFNEQFKINKTTLLFALLIICIPFVSSLGTNNSLFLQFLFYGGTFGLGLFLWIDKLNNLLIKTVIIFLTFLVTTVQITYKKMNTPYRMEALRKQTELVDEVAYLKGLNVDIEMAELIKEAVDLQNHSSEYIFVFSEQLGLSILTDKKPLLFTWINESSYHLIHQNLVNKKDLLQEDILFVLPKKGHKKEVVLNELKMVKELSFQNNYNKYKTITIRGEEFELYTKIKA